jgi:hypothetical protein
VKGRDHLEDPGIDDNIKMDVRGGVDWIYLVQDRGCREHGNEPSGSIKGVLFLD